MRRRCLDRWKLDRDAAAEASVHPSTSTQPADAARLPARPGAAERLAHARTATVEEIRLYELRHAEAVSQVALAGRLDITQSAVSKLEHADDVRVSTLRQYSDALGARLELVAVFDDDDRRVPTHLS